MTDSRAVNELIQDVEELLATLGDAPSAHIQELKDRVRDAIDALTEHRDGVTRRLRRYASSLDRYITGYPRLGFATGVAVGGVIVYLAGLLSPRE
jgi:ElaB/YqjD/DUF883 family membrane-anchored ribosome-binding protein